MKKTQRSRLMVVATAGALVLAACGSSSKSSDSSSAATTAAAGAETTIADASSDTTAESTDTTAADSGSSGAWKVNTDDCSDPEAANAKIEGTLKIGSVMPLSGGSAAIAFAPVADGFKAYMDYANENKLVPGITLEASIEDDQYNKDLTPGAVEKLLDSGVSVFSGIIGSPNNAAVRDTLNEECVPQLEALTGSPAWGDVANYPWTTGALIPYTIESKAFAADIKSAFPAGANVAVFNVNNEFGQVYADAFNEIAKSGGITVVESQTIEATDEAPPTAQVNAIAAKKPDAIMAVPLGAGCPTFLSELVNAEAANPGWTPRVYLTSTCASALILGIAGPAANGLYTLASAGLLDIGNPAVVAANPKAKAYADYMTKIGKADIVTTAGAGWSVAEVTVAILAQAAASPDGLTRASIIDAARNFTYEPSLGRAGVVYKMDGEKDPFLAEAVQVVQYDATTKIFTDIGPLNTSFES